MSAKPTFVKAARKNYPDHDIKKGESYYWWKFAYGSKQYSKTAPKRSQLTQSAFYAGVYDIEDDLLAGADANDSLPSLRDDVVSALEELRDTCQESLDNMPEALQEADTGQLLQERIDALENAISEFEDLDLEEPTDDDLDMEEVQQQKKESDEDFEARQEEEREARTQAYWESKLEEFNGISIDAP